MEIRILIIEDDNSIRMNLTELLEENDYNVFSASGGKEGLEMAKNLLPDLIISDIMLPDIDGYEILEEINKLKPLNFIPFIFLTAKTETKDMRKGMLLGAADYIMKPYDAVELLNVVQLRLSKSQELKKHYTGSSNSQQKKKLNENDRALVMVNGKPLFIRLSQIVFISSDNVYTNIHRMDQKPVLVRKTMKEWEDILPEELFIRIHRSTIINSDFITRIEKWTNRTYKVFMQNTEQTFVISQRYALRLKSKII